MLRKTLGLMTLGLITMASSSANAALSFAVASDSVTGAIPASTASFGFNFTAHMPLVVNELGAYSFNNGTTPGVVVGQTVSLYDVTTHTLLGTSTIAGPLTPNNFNYALLNGGGTVTLNTTDTYSVFTVFNNGQNVATGTTVFSSDITETLDGYGPAGSPPISAYPVIATDFQYSPVVSTVPEPASIAMMGLGLAGVVLARRKMAKRSA